MKKLLAKFIKYTGICPECKRYLDDHDLLKGKPICPRDKG